MITKIVTAPTREPLDTAETVTHLRLGGENLEPTPSAPIVALAGAGAGNVDNGSHRYRLTLVTADGETDGGDISTAVVVVDKTVNGKVSLSEIPLGGTAVTARRIYRTKAGLEVYFLVATISDNLTTMYVDNVADVNLGAGIPALNTTSDPEIARWIKAAREGAEQYLRRALITQTWRVILPCFPSSGIIKLPFPPLQTVSEITYIDTNGDVQTLDTDQYDVDADSEPGRVIRAYSVVWPSTRPVWNAVTIEFVCGYGDESTDVPELFRHGMKLLISDFNENREIINVGNIINALPGIRRCFADRAREIV